MGKYIEYESIMMWFFLMSYNNAVEFSILTGQAAFLVLLILIEGMELPSCIWPLDRRSRVRITTNTQPSMIRSQWRKISHVLFGWKDSLCPINQIKISQSWLSGRLCMRNREHNIFLWVCYIALFEKQFEKTRLTGLACLWGSIC